MHKKILLIFLIFLLIGCKKIENNDNNYIELINDCLKKNSVTNEVSRGYKYYLPKGAKKLHDYDYNQIFKVDNNYIYLYIDVISYYHKKDLIKADNSNPYYYQLINNDNKKGYIKIEKKDEKFLVNILYNYSKVEFYTNENDLNKLITISSIILNSIKYNDNIIEKILEGNIGNFKEFTYEVEKPNNAGSNFSQYLEEYVQKEEKEKKAEQLPDE